MATRNQLPALQAPTPVTFSSPIIPEAYANPGLSMQQVMAILRGSRKKIVTTCLSVFALVTAVGLILPPTYVATVTLLINPEVNDPIGGKEFPYQLLANYMTTQLELIPSPAVLRPVVEKLKLYENEDYVSDLDKPENERRAAAEKKVLKNLAIGEGKLGSQLIYVSFTGHTPDEAAGTANLIADIYASKDYERRGPDNERDQAAFKLEVAALKTKVEQAQAQVTAFQRRTGIVATEAQGAVGLATLTQLEVELLDAQSKRRALEIAAASGPTQTYDGASSALLSDLRIQLAAQQARMDEYLVTDGARNPRVIELQSQIEATKRSIAGASRTVTTSNSTDLTNARQLEAKVKAALEDQRRKVITDTQLGEEGDRLKAELTSAQENYRRAFEKLDEISRSSTSSYTNIKLVNRAIPPVKPSSRPIVVTMVLGLLLGAVLGVILPLVTGLLYRRVRCRDDIERDYGIAVIAEFNAIPN